MTDMTPVWILLGVWWLPIILLIRSRRYSGLRQLRWIVLLMLGGWFAFVFLSIEAQSLEVPDRRQSGTD